MMHIKNRIKLVEFILANLFILNISAAVISNYSLNIFIIKIISSAVLLLILFLDTKLHNFNLQEIMKGNDPKKMFILIGLFTGYLGITLIYSGNPLYGAQKILNFLISTVPSIIAFYYLIVTLSKERFKIFIVALIVITIITITYILIDYPFDQGSIYEYTAGRWSHVIYGRMIGSFAVVLLLYMLSRRDIKQVLFFSLITSVSVYGLYLSALRSAMLGVALCLVLSALFVVYEMIARGEKREERRSQLVGIAVVIIFTLSFIIIIPNPGIIETRFDNLTQIEDLEFGGDEPINSRIDALKISKELFFANPVFGVGFGGFRSYNEFTELVKYPHNIFVEMAVEGGVVGLLVLCALLLVMIKSVFRFSKSHPEFISGSAILLFTFFAFFLSLFSKELSNQSLLWIFIAFTGIKKQT